MPRSQNAKLPHFDINTAVHIAYRLAGSVPVKQLEYLNKSRALKIERAVANALLRPPKISGDWLRREKQAIHQRHHLALDNYLHNNSNGPYHLQDTRIAEEVIASWRLLHERKEIYLYVVCIMSNHVHLIVDCPVGVEAVSISSVVRKAKGYTARVANKLLDRKGTAFWAPNYFDTSVRRGRFLRAVWYVLHNPVKAGLVEQWEDWPNTWLNPEYELLFRSECF
ncbi:transposase [Neolewinella antarctica]|uniref:REP element-mobilizing transposase RayT n=1 Tax=Neolewinella antarctica TaxID=442734 RepID=A0ABX0XEY9_9BACT|nr:transposase [Neolewinella antarctica]NJC27456.1 REP element-mobilizing transposase RayT [Neolewinella antarctica]